jgi:hypothetical protein
LALDVGEPPREISHQLIWWFTAKSLLLWTGCIETGSRVRLQIWARNTWSSMLTCSPMTSLGVLLTDGSQLIFKSRWGRRISNCYFRYHHLEVVKPTIDAEGANGTIREDSHSSISGNSRWKYSVDLVIDPISFSPIWVEVKGKYCENTQ